LCFFVVRLVQFAKLNQSHRSFCSNPFTPPKKQKKSESCPLRQDPLLRFVLDFLLMVRPFGESLLGEIAQILSQAYFSVHAPAYRMLRWRKPTIGRNLPTNHNPYSDGRNHRANRPQHRVVRNLIDMLLCPAKSS
jgi:hypothetical protein